MLTALLSKAPRVLKACELDPALNSWVDEQILARKLEAHRRSVQFDWTDDLRKRLHGAKFRMQDQDDKLQIIFTELMFEPGSFWEYNPHKRNRQGGKVFLEDWFQHITQKRVKSQIRNKQNDFKKNPFVSIAPRVDDYEDSSMGLSEQTLSGKVLLPGSYDLNQDELEDRTEYIPIEERELLEDFKLFLSKQLHGNVLVKVFEALWENRQEEHPQQRAAEQTSLSTGQLNNWVGHLKDYVNMFSAGKPHLQRMLLRVETTPRQPKQPTGPRRITWDPGQGQEVIDVYLVRRGSPTGETRIRKLDGSPFDDGELTIKVLTRQLRF